MSKLLRARRRVEPGVGVQPVLIALPDRVQPFRLAEAGASVTGVVCIDELPRLASALTPTGAKTGATPGGEAHACFRFSMTNGVRHRVTGSVRARVTLVCERCLEPLVDTLSSVTELTLVRSDAEAARLDPSSEPWVVAGECASLHELLEDELLLALPIMPTHEHGTCRTLAAAAPHAEPEAAATRAHPFSTLKDLLSRSLS